VTELTEWTTGVRFPEGVGNFLFATASTLALGPTHLLLQWVPGAVSLGVKRPGLRLTTYLHLATKLMRGAVSLIFIYLFIYIYILPSKNETAEL
jgi:hypothetical protein